MKRKSLSKAFIVRVLLILLPCQGGLFAWAYFQERESLADSLQQKISTVSRLITNASAKGMTEFDFTSLGLFMDEMMKDGDFIGMSLKDDKGYEVLARQKPSKGAASKSVYPVIQGGTELGKLEIAYSKDRVNRLLQQRLLVKAGMQLLIVFLIALFIFVYFRINIARRIKKIETIIGQMTDGDLTVRLEDDSPDELGKIGAGVDCLGQRLAESVAHITTFSENVANTAQSLTAAFSTTKAALNHQHDATEEISVALSTATKSQTQITVNTRRLLDFSQGNASAVAENLAVSEGIAERIDALHQGINSAHETLLAIDASAKWVAGLAGQAALAVEKAVDSSSSIKASFHDIERIVVESSRLSEQTTKVISDKGIVAVTQTQQSMNKIFNLSESLGNTITKLSGGSMDIAKILAVINEITDKTRLLSLNASIIAAQSGEHGHGFAVVANEMKQLSDRTAHSTKEIAAILNTIHHDIADAVSKTGEASVIVQTGSKDADHAGHALQEILSASLNSHDMVSKIQQAVNHQQQQLEQVSSALGKLHEVNAAVSKSAIAEESNIGALGVTVGDLRNAMEHVRVATEQQVASMHEMLQDIEDASGRAGEIADSVNEEQQVNVAICASLSDVVEVGLKSIEALNSASARVEAVNSEVLHMREEIKQFKV
jgi:methyl-accepting chemotaxis protein